MIERLLSKYIPAESSIKVKVRSRLNATPTDEVVRWADNTLMAVGKNLSEMRKSLSRTNTEQALAYITDTKQGALSLLAAMESLEQRFK